MGQLLPLKPGTSVELGQAKQMLSPRILNLKAMKSGQEEPWKVRYRSDSVHTDHIAPATWLFRKALVLTHLPSLVSKPPSIRRTHVLLINSFMLKMARVHLSLANLDF